jgi:hypothetical protein
MGFPEPPQFRILPGAQAPPQVRALFWTWLDGRGYPVAIRFAQVTGQRAALYGSCRAGRRPIPGPQIHAEQHSPSPVPYPLRIRFPMRCAPRCGHGFPLRPQLRSQP